MVPDFFFIPCMALFYHLDRKQTLFGEAILNRNPPDYSPTDAVGIPVDRSLIALKFPNGISQHGQYYLIYVAQNTGQVIQQTGEFAAKGSSALEMYWELVRQSEFPDKPSRFTRFFAFKKPEEVKAFAGNGPGTIYEVEADIWEEFDFHWLKQGRCLAEQWSMAQAYWSKRPTNSPLWECLLEPPVKILRVV